MSVRRFTVSAGTGAYDVIFVDRVKNIIFEIGELKDLLIIIDKNVKRLYKNQLTKLLDKVQYLEIEAVEESKTLKGITKVFEFYQKNKVIKQTKIVAIGGGIIQDIVTFTSHVYYRGIKWYLVPTTLLSMGDSCIGSKCGINYNDHKNQLGVYHAPSKVLPCVEFLNTLEDRHIRSGYGEVFRLFLTGEKTDFNKLIQTMDTDGLRNTDTEEFVYRALLVKKGYIEEDEYETGRRKALNFGHSFGHAVESVTNFEVPHGIGVAWGIDAVSFISYKRGLISLEKYQELNAIIKKHFSMKVSKPLETLKLMESLNRDKKFENGKLTFVLFEDQGKLPFVPISLDEDFEVLLNEYLKQQSVLYWD